MGPYQVYFFNTQRKIVHIRDSSVETLSFNGAQIKPYLTPEGMSYYFLYDLSSVSRPFGTPKEDSILLTELLDPRVEIYLSPEMIAAKCEELKGLLDRDFLKVILREETPINGNVCQERFVLAIKFTEVARIKYEARYVIGGKRDCLQHFMIRRSRTLLSQSVRLFLAIIVVFKFRFWMVDELQAYLESSGSSQGCVH